jgi:6-phosphogluconolactonase
MTNSPPRKIVAVEDPNKLAAVAAERVIARIKARSGRVAICLTGGSGPKKLYELLGSEYRDQIPWERVHWFIGDDRFVPQHHELSNMGTARRIFLERCAPAENVHPFPTTAGNPNEAATIYQTELASFYGADGLDAGRPLFDVVLMGIGPDGHTASLFPNAPALCEKRRWVVGVGTANVAPFVPRITLTLLALASCREMLFLVSGPEKREIMTRLLSGEDLPAARALSHGETIWLADKAALPENFHDA